MTAHITQLKILHGVSLLCVCFVPGASPVNTVSHNQDTIKRTFNCFRRLFAQKAAYATPVCSHRSQPLSLEIGSLAVPRSAAFPQKTGVITAVFITTPSRENGIAERPQTLRYPEIKNKFSAEYGQSATTTTAASGGNREELLGQRPAKRKCRPRHDADAGCRNPMATAIPNRPT